MSLACPSPQIAVIFFPGLSAAISNALLYMATLLAVASKEISRLSVP